MLLYQIFFTHQKKKRQFPNNRFQQNRFLRIKFTPICAFFSCYFDLFICSIVFGLGWWKRYIFHFFVIKTFFFLLKQTKLNFFFFYFDFYFIPCSLISHEMLLVWRGNTGDKYNVCFSVNHFMYINIKKSINLRYQHRMGMEIVYDIRH